MKYSLLALGDSYTIGEQVRIAESFPYQTIQRLRSAGYNFLAPEIIAATGFTTDELKHAIDETALLPPYNFVSLLIGVNNQYRGRSVDEFRLHLRELLKFAIEKADGVTEHVILLSIPDWGMTPFAIDKSPALISSEIDIYNFICETEAGHFQTKFMNITATQREHAHLDEFLAPDKLHPSAKEYSIWAQQLANVIIESLSS